MYYPLPTLFQKQQKSPKDPEMSEEDLFSEDSSAERDLEVNIGLDKPFHKATVKPELNGHFQKD